MLAGLLAACGAAAEPGATVTATLGVPSDAASSSGSPSDGGSPAQGMLSYPGRTGATALELLLEVDPSAEITGEGDGAFVTAIGGRAADDSRSEFWALSVDGEPAQVGAGALEAKDGQEITWTLETY